MESKREQRKNWFLPLFVFMRKYKIIFFIIIGAVLLFFVVNSIYSAVISQKVQNFLDGKTFLEDCYREGYYASAYHFSGNTVTEEYWRMKEYEIVGNINDTGKKYRVSASLLSKRIDIKLAGDSYSELQLTIDDNGKIVPLFKANNWSQISYEKLAALRLQYMCDHEFGPEIITQEATCSVSGQVSLTCSKCGYTKTQPTQRLEHTYQNRVCLVCGAEKQPEKADIDANSWYVYEDVLYIQNCLVKSAISVSNGRGMMVTYHAVCQHCHAIEEYFKMAGPEVNYPVDKIHICDWCGKNTIVKFKIG